MAGVFVSMQKNVITMQIGCLRGCVYGTCVTLAEVNECEVTMTE